MPQPLKDGHTLRNKPKMLLEYPEHAARIGLIAAEWAALENHLIEMSTFSLFVFSEHEHDARDVAVTIIRSIDGLAARLNMIRNLIVDRLPEGLVQYFNDRLERQIRERARERNRVVHGHWHACEKYPNDLILVDPPNKPMRYSIKDLDDIADRINATLNEVATYCHQVTEAVQALSPTMQKLKARLAESIEGHPVLGDLSKNLT